MSVLFYRRPEYLDKAPTPINATECARYAERAKKCERAIPDGLGFEHVIGNKAMPVCRTLLLSLYITLTMYLALFTE